MLIQTPQNVNTSVQQYSDINSRKKLNEKQGCISNGTF